MQFADRSRHLARWTGVILALIGLLSSALNFTAVPVVLDLPMMSLAIASLSVSLLVFGLWQELKRPALRNLRMGVGATALLVSLGAAVWSLDLRFLSYGASEVRFDNKGVGLAGTMYTPRSRGPHPAIVFIHGSGPETRAEYAFFAKLFARNGIVGLAYDKRGAGHSTGKLYESNYGDYAQDALAAVRFLEQREDVIPRCVGLMGFSEGEWVAPLAATQSSEVAFLIVVAYSGVSPAKQVNEEIAIRLRDRGHPEESVARALALNDRVFEYQRTGQGREALQRDLREAQREPWFRDAHDIPEELYPLEEYAWWRSVMDFAPGPVWQQVKVPVLLVKGGRDPNSDVDVARKEVESALVKGGNQGAEFVVFPEGDHSLLKWPLGRHIPPPVFVDGYLDTLMGWVGQQTCDGR